MLSPGDSITVEGFGDSNANGSYTYIKDINGYPYYVKDPFYFMIYRDSWMPWSTTPSYYLVNVVYFSGSIPLEVPKYRKESTDALDTSVPWIELNDQSSGETQTGIVVQDPESSSSSSSSSLSSQSSNSSSSSESSSSSTDSSASTDSSGSSESSSNSSQSSESSSSSSQSSESSSSDSSESSSSSSDSSESSSSSSQSAVLAVVNFAIVDQDFVGA